MKIPFPSLAGRTQFFNPIRAECPDNGRKSDLSGAPSMAQITVDVVFRWIGRSYPVTGIELDRWGDGAGHTNAPDRGGPRSALGNAVNVFSWHTTDVRIAAPEGLLTGALPTFGAECLVIAAFQTWRRGVAKVGT